MNSTEQRKQTKTQCDEITPIFVLGSPRSGTTMLGELIGSSKKLLNIGELSAIYYACHVSKLEFNRIMSDYKDTYLQCLIDSTIAFIEKQCRIKNLSTFVESSPWNILIVDKLTQLYPSATFIVSYRNVYDVTRSMQRSWIQGYKWAGPTDNERAKLWARHYANVEKLPKNNTIFFNYDNLALAPEDEINQVVDRLSQRGLPSDLDLSTLAISHANTQKRNTCASIDNEGNLKFAQSITEEAKQPVNITDEETIGLIQDTNEKVSRLQKSLMQ